MPIDKINYKSSRSVQSVFEGESRTALEMVGIATEKVDECVELVNGVEQSAIEARSIVDTMKAQQDDFVLDNADTRAQLITDNQAYIDTLTADKATFNEQMTTALGNTENSMNTALNTFKDNINAQLDTFTTDTNQQKQSLIDSVQESINSSSTQIVEAVGNKIDTMNSDGTLSQIINNEILADVQTSIAQNEISVSDVAPASANLWYDTKAEVFLNFDSDSIVFTEI